MIKPLLAALLTLLAACAATQDTPPPVAGTEPAPGTVSVHMNGTLGAGIGYSNMR